MNRKLRNFLWITVLVLFSFPAGFMTVFVRSSVSRSEYILTLIISGIAFVITIGIISVIIFAILRDKKKNDPAKTSLTVYTVFLVLFLLSSGFEMKGAIRERSRKEFMEKNKDAIRWSLTKRINEMSVTEPKLKDHTKQLLDAIDFKMTYENVLVDSLMNAPSFVLYINQSPEVTKVIHDCDQLVSY